MKSNSRLKNSDIDDTRAFDVAILTSFDMHEGTATRNRVESFASAFLESELVASLTIVCPKSHRGSPSFLNQKNFKEVATPKLRKTKFFLRAFDELKAAICLWRSIWRENYHIVLVTVPSIFLLVPLIFSTKKIVVVVDIRDAIWTYLQNDRIERVAAQVFKFVARLAFRKSKFISVTNTFELREVASLTAKNVVYIPNGISRYQFKKFASIPESAKGESEQNITEIAYFGNIGLAQKLEHLLSWARFKEGVRIKILGDGAALKILVREYGFDGEKYKFTGYLNTKDILEEIKTSEILFAQIGEEYSTAIPTKIFEYIVSGKKVLAGLPKGGAAEAVFAQFSGVYIFQTGSVEALEEAFRKAVNAKLSRVEIDNNRELIQAKYLRESGARVLASKAVNSVIQ